MRRRYMMLCGVPLFAFAVSEVTEVRAQACSFAVTDVLFGNVDLLSNSPTDTTGIVSATCTGLQNTNIRVCPNINAGSGGATSSIRHMRSSVNQPLNYIFYQDAARTVLWGSVTQPALGAPPPIDLRIRKSGIVSATRTLYARVLTNQIVSPGSYTSTFSGAQTRFNWRTYQGNPPSCANITQDPTQPAFTVQTHVGASCNVTAQNIDFGSHGFLKAAVDGAGAITVSCLPGINYTVGLNNGLSGSSATTRRMTLGSQGAVVYGLFKDTARTQRWGDSGGERVSGMGALSAQIFPVYGRVQSQITPPPGTYNDTVVVTVTY